MIAQHTSMRDFSNTPYPNLLQYLDEGFMHDTDSTNYADYLLWINQIEDIQNLMNLYSITRKKMEHIHTIHHWSSVNLSVATEELRMFVNDKILSYYLNETQHTDKDLCACLANLLICKNYESTRKVFMQGNEHLNTTVLQIHESKKRLLRIKEEYQKNKYPKNSNGYKMLKSEYQQHLDKLNGLGYVQTDDDINLSQTFDIKPTTAETSSKKKFFIILAVVGVVILGYCCFTNFTVTIASIFALIILLGLLVTIIRPDL